jgi:glucosylceramidase
MKFFDTSVAHDESSGMLPMMRDAQDLVKKRGHTLKIFASPWSPPAWMKNLRDGKHSMLGSATPNGLNETYQGAWAKYFSKFITAYKAHSVDLWGITVQNEPEFPAPWEACAYTPQYEADFVSKHLGPTLRKDHPGLKIIGFDHNKDHVVTWAKVLYGDSEAAKYFDGIGVHWYGGLNTQHLNTTHFINPDKFILPTEACNCGGVAFQKDDPLEWWSRAEKIAIDILEDIKWWSVGWVDWNLVLGWDGVQKKWGGPNHLGNLCDANIIADPSKTLKGDTVIQQASYYYMGHFSRFIPPGSKRVGLTNSVTRPPLKAKDIMNKRLRFDPCSDGDGLTWKFDLSSGTLGQLGLCAELDEDGEGIVMHTCDANNKKQQWLISPPAGPQGGVTVQNGELTDKCLTFLTVGGPKLNLDPGVDVQAGFAEKCGPVPAGQTQIFQLAASGAKSFPDGFHIKTSEGNCMLPVGADTITFDAVAFQTPAGDISIVAMNRGDYDLKFDIYETSSKSGAKQLQVPKHGIASFVIAAKTKDEIINFI